MKYRFTEEQKKEIEEARDKNQNKRVEKRLRVLSLRAEGRGLKEIAAMTGYSRSHVSGLVSLYFSEGLEAITGNHYHGNHRNMSIAEEEQLLETFREKAESGQMIEVKAIKTAYAEKVGHTIGTGQIYYVLRRHKWRKVMPRSKHPNKASEEVIETSKKLTLGSGNC